MNKKQKNNLEVVQPLTKPIGTFCEADLIREKNEFNPNEFSPNANNYVSLKNINKVYDKKVHAVVDFNLEVKQREFVVFVGPSGCGKSTTLRMIAGLEEVSAGEIFIDGVFANELSPKDRDIAMVFQTYSLYPNMSVYDNLAFSLKVRHIDKSEIRQRVMEAANILEISNLLDRKPKQLSGGQRQRVALGRAIVRNARVFLMDEPLSNLDAKLRVQMRSEIIKLHKRIKATTIYVTHDQTEAMTMADRIVVMKDGHIQQIGTPLEIYRQPANQFVASFMGAPAMNFIDTEYENGTLIFIDGTVKTLSKDDIKKHDEFYCEELKRIKSLANDYAQFLVKEHHDLIARNPRGASFPFDENSDEDLMKLREHAVQIEKIIKGERHQILFGIRPEDIRAVNQDNNKGFEARITLSELLGEQYYIHFDYGGKEIISSVFSAIHIKNGELIRLSMSEDKIHLFDYLTGKSIF